MDAMDAIQPYLPAIFMGLALMGCLGLLLSGIAAMKQAKIAKKLFKLRCEQVQREQ